MNSFFPISVVRILILDHRKANLYHTTAKTKITQNVLLKYRIVLLPGFNGSGFVI